MNQDTTSTNIYTSIIEATAQQSYPMGTLYVVATPIGNIADISLRALHLLSIVDAVACEDTRNTAQLLTRYGLHKPLIAAHQHNEHEIAVKIISRLQAGERIALVSDAGTPAVSDPGAIIVDAVRNAKLNIFPMPGASAAITALSASGFIQDQFYFVGFLPAKSGQRETALKSLIHHQATLIFYEAPHRIIECTQALFDIFGKERRIVFAREISKLFEEIHRCHLSEALAWLQSDQHREKGEYVLLIEGEKQETNQDDVESRRILSILLEECSVKQATQLAASITGLKKNALYQLALDIKNKSEQNIE
jgi:16S rRNA (cytidine1402-2'-O)-methyltransferase